MDQPLHTKLLTAAARAVLRPLGLSQRGRSRLWRDDQGWWLIVVEFQPYSLSKGSFLNVGAMWLWNAQDYLSFDDGGRVEDFAPFEDESQFSLVAERLARRAAEEVGRYRSLFPSVHAAAQYLAAKSPKGFWDTFHAAVACGLSGNVVDAKRFFQEVAGTDHRQDWAQAAASLAQEYYSAVEDLPSFRHRINEVIIQTRRTLRLPEMAGVKLSEED